MTRSFEQIGAELGELVARKNEAYGSSFAKCGDFLRLLFPEGIAPERLEDALLLARIFDKQMRIATARDAFGESPWQDIAGYGLLGTQLHEKRIEECASVRQGAGEESTAPNDSAGHDASRPTIANADAKSATPSRPLSPPHSASTSASTDAPAPSATVSAFESQAALGIDKADFRVNALVFYARNRNAMGKCAACSESANHAVWIFFFGKYEILSCSSACRDAFKRLLRGAA